MSAETVPVLPDNVEYLLGKLRHEAELRQKQKRILMLAFLLSAIGCACAYTLGPPSTPRYCVMMVILLPAFCFLISIVYNSRRQHKMRLLLSKLKEEPRAIGSLTILYTNRDMMWGGLAKDIQHSLMHLLPQVQASDARWFSQTHLKTLISLTGGEKPDLPLAIAIFKALEQVGNGECVKQVADIARTSNDPRIARAAKNCLPFLQQHGFTNLQAQTLLRASGATALPADELLHPAAPVSHRDHREQLLRPTK